MRIPATLLRIILAFLALAAAGSLMQGLNNAVLRPDGSQDNQWGPSRALLQHIDPYAAALDHAHPSPFILSQAPNYPASGLVFLWPYAVWKWPVAKTLWALSNVLFTAIIIFCLFRLLPKDTSSSAKLLLVTLFIAGTPWRNGVGNGQHALFTLAFFLLTVVWISHNTRGAGVMLAASWLKYTIAFPLSLFFARSRSIQAWTVIIVATAMHVALTIFSAVWAHASPVALLLGPLRVAEVATGAGYLDVFVIASNLGWSLKILPSVSALIILGITYAAVRRDTDELSCLSTLSLACMTLVFHNGYDFVVLVIPLAYALRERAAGRRAKAYLIVIAMIWFVDKLVRVPGAQLSQFIALYFWVEIAVFYGALGVDWLEAFRERPVEPTLRQLSSPVPRDGGERLADEIG